MNGELIIMMKILSIILLIFLSNCTVKKVKEFSKPEKIIVKNMTKYVDFSWKIDGLYIVNLTKDTQEKVLKKCDSKKFTLIKIDTSVNGLATGRFRCN